MKTFSPKDVKERGLVVVSGLVYNTAELMSIHPGGRTCLQNNAGRDASELFLSLHRNPETRAKLDKYRVGKLQKRKPGWIFEVMFFLSMCVLAWAVYVVYLIM